MKFIKVLISLLLTINLFGCSLFNRFNEDHLDFDSSEEIQYYENNFYYSQLDDYEQTIYKGLYHACTNGYDSFDVGLVYDENKILKTIEAFTYEWPQYYWYQGYVCYKYNTYTAIQQQHVENIADCLILNTQIEETALKIVDECKTDSQYETIKNIHDYLINNVKYVKDAEYSQDYRSVFLTNESVCAGIGFAFEYLCNLAGFDCVCVKGNVVTTEEDNTHLWNMIKLDDDYYYIDVTWDNKEDDDGNNLAPKYEYFFMSDEILNIDHVLDERYTYPECDSLDFYYFNEPGIYLEEYDRATVVNNIVNWMKKGYSEFMFRYANDDIANDIIDYLYSDKGICDIYRDYISYYYDISYGYKHDSEHNILYFSCYSN